MTDKVENITKDEAGFTLIEIIVTLVLIGVMATVGGMAIVQGVRGYMFSRENASMAQKAQLAMVRLTTEMNDLIEVTADCTAVSMGIRNTRYGAHLMGLHDGKIKIAAEGVALADGDVLIDGVNSFSITYYSGNTSSTTWPRTNDIKLMSAIDINLKLDRSDGSFLEFATRVMPRNNKNRGGMPSDCNVLTRSDYGCFVATASYGDEYHPMVLLLKDFRDKCLLTWAGGEFIVRVYYALGPYLADIIAGKPLAMFLSRCALLPFVGTAFLALYAPLAIPVILIVSFAIMRFFFILMRQGSKDFFPKVSGKRGSILLYLIVTILIFSSLGAAMLSMFSSSTFNQMYANQKRKAYYLAESGFRYAASEFLNSGSESAKLSTLEALHDKTFTLLNDAGSFMLKVYPYWYRTTSVNGITLHGKVYGEFPPDLNLSSGGYLKIGDNLSDGLGSFRYSNGIGVGSAINFIRISGDWPSIPAGTDIHLAGLSVSQTVTEGGSLNFQVNTGGDSFPLRNGNFTLNPAPSGTTANTLYNYEKRNGKTLEGITLADSITEWHDLSVDDSTYVVLEKFLRLSSTGIVGNSSSEIQYNVPMGWLDNGGGFVKEQVHDSLNNLANWDAGNGSGQYGSHAIQNTGGDSALKVVTAESPVWSPEIDVSTIQYNWADTNTNLEQSWRDAGGLLSYDIQVKVLDHPQQKGGYSTGVAFRLSNADEINGPDCYGVAFLRAYRDQSTQESQPYDNIPDEIKPSAIWDGALETQGQFEYSQPAIVVWQRKNRVFNWVACKLITYDHTNQNYIVDNRNYLVKWPTILIRIVEAKPLPFTYGIAQIKCGDSIKGKLSGASARVNGTPLVSNSGTWTSGDPTTGIFTISNVVGSFQRGEELLVNGETTGRAKVDVGAGDPVGTRTNYLRVYYGDSTAHDTSGGDQLDNARLANLRGDVYWPPDDAQDAGAVSDHFTLVKWLNGPSSAINNAIAIIQPSTLEPEAVIRTDALLSPVWVDNTSTFSPSETVALHTLGVNGNKFYFDDFSIQLDLKTTAGLLPPTQQ